MANAEPARPGNYRWPELLYVNGASSSGKTTICRALQEAIHEPYLCVGFDDFIFLSAPRYYLGGDTPSQGRADDFTAQGFRTTPTSGPGEPVSVTAEFGPVFRRLIDAMPAAVRALLKGGNAVIFDDVLHDRDMYEGRRRAFADLDVFAVAVVCDVDVLEEREREREDRVIGRARGLAAIVHDFCLYDVEVDTGTTDVDGCVAQILRAVSARPTGQDKRGAARPFFRERVDGRPGSTD